MSSQPSSKKTESFTPPLAKSFSCTQIDLFQTFLANSVEQREKLSNAIPLWDCLPRYSMSRQQAQKMRKEGSLPPLLTIACKYLGQSLTVQIQPARIFDDAKNVVEYYPSSSDELVEEALRKIATLQNQGFFEDDDSVHPRSGVSFTIYQLREELRKQGHARSHKEIVLSLKILSRSIIEISAEDKRTKIYDVNPYFSRLSSVSRSDLAEDPNAKWYVEFHPLITKAISALDYRQYNYELMMSHSTQLARWLYKYLVMKFTYAETGKSFKVRFSTVKRDSGLLDAYARHRKAIETLSNALNELIDKKIILSVTEEKIIGQRRNIEDVVYTIFPSIQFSNDTKRSNANCQLKKKSPY